MTDTPAAVEEKKSAVELVKQLKHGFAGPKGYGRTLIDSVKLSTDGRHIDFQLPGNDEPAYTMRELLKKDIPATAYTSTREETGENTYRVDVDTIANAPDYQCEPSRASDRMHREPVENFRVR